MKALQNESILQILAEPNLVAANGKEASFLVGGEFPVPIVQGGANVGAITIQFKEFGIRLTFVPVITENQSIRLHLRQEVSTIDTNNSVSLNGFVIPALSTRRAETDVELAQRQSFVVAGLIDNRESESYAKIPGLSAVPLLGQLFRSKETRANRSELVMIVTPEITDPAAPADSMTVPNFPKPFLVPIDPAKPKGRAGSAPIRQVGLVEVRREEVNMAYGSGADHVPGVLLIAPDQELAEEFKTVFVKPGTIALRCDFDVYPELDVLLAHVDDPKPIVVIDVSTEYSRRSTPFTPYAGRRPSRCSSLSIAREIPICYWIVFGSGSGSSSQFRSTEQSRYRRYGNCLHPSR